MMTFKRNSICCQTMTNQILASTLKAKKTQSVAKSYWWKNTPFWAQKQFGNNYWQGQCLMKQVENLITWPIWQPRSITPKGSTRCSIKMKEWLLCWMGNWTFRSLPPDDWNYIIMHPKMISVSNWDLDHSARENVKKIMGKFDILFVLFHFKVGEVNEKACLLCTAEFGQARIVNIVAKISSWISA